MPRGIFPTGTHLTKIFSTVPRGAQHSISKCTLFPVSVTRLALGFGGRRGVVDERLELGKGRRDTVGGVRVDQSPL